MQLEHILEMGGYGVYVWPAYIITFVVFAINIASCLIEARRIKNFDIENH